MGDRQYVPTKATKDERGGGMTINESYVLYCEQYRRHLDELASFLVGWDMDRITVTVKDNVLTLTRPDKKRMRLNLQQVIGLLRYMGRMLQQIDEQEDKEDDRKRF